MRLPTWTPVSLVAALVVIASCNGGGGGGSTGPSADAPVISDLQVVPRSPEQINTAIEYSVRVNTVDPQGDVFNGTCELTSSLGTVSIPISALTPGTDPDAIEGSVTCFFSVTAFAPIQLTVTMTVIDRAGHRSNSLTFVLGISEVLSGQNRSARDPGSSPILRPGRATRGR